MVRLLPIALLAGALALPGPGWAADWYSFIDSDGVIHVTNVSQDARYRRIRMRSTGPNGLHRITISGRATSNGRFIPITAERARQYDDQIFAAAEKYGLAASLLKAVMAAESNFDPRAVSDKGACGLMQLMPGTARDLLVDDPYDPVQNIDGGARYLRQLHDQFGNDLVKVLAAYNAGPEAVRRWGGTVPPFPETQAYVRKVMALYELYLKGR